MNELREIALDTINNSGVDWMKVHSTQDVYQELLKIETKMVQHKIYDLAVEVSDLLFIERKV